MKYYIELFAGILGFACTLFIFYYYRIMSEYEQNDYDTLATIVHVLFFISVLYLFICTKSNKNKEKNNE